MLIEILLGIIFITSAFTLWYLFSRKLPELIAIPDHIVIERIHGESTKFHLFILHFKSFFFDHGYKEFLGGILGKLLYRLHIVLMRSDNAIMGLLRRFRASQNVEDNEKEPTIHVLPEFMPSIQETPLPIVMFSAMSSVVARPKKISVAVELKEQDGAEIIPLIRKTLLKNLSKDSERFPIRQEEESRIIQEENTHKRHIRKSKIVSPETRE